MDDPLNRKSASAPIGVFRRYVTDFVNRQDFIMMREFMAEDYTLSSSGFEVKGRDGVYADAVRRQMEQFPGLVFTPHEMFHVAGRIGIRFTEHGASVKDAGRRAAWPSIAIYTVENGRLARCAIEQDYFTRRTQLDSGAPNLVDPPAIAPWDTPESTPNPAAEATVRAWLSASAFLNTPGVQVDDSRSTGVIERMVDQAAVEVIDMISGDDKVAFQAILTGVLADDFARDVSPQVGQPVKVYMSGLVTVTHGKVAAGNVIRDRWGLYRKLARPKPQAAATSAQPTREPQS